VPARTHTVAPYQRWTAPLGDAQLAAFSVNCRPRFAESLTVMFRIVQPYGRDVGRESTTISEHASVTDAFAEIDRLAAEMMRTGARLETVTLFVVDATGAIVTRPGAH
jgi:hypothetical protein